MPFIPLIHIKLSRNVEIFTWLIYSKNKVSSLKTEITFLPCMHVSKQRFVQLHELSNGPQLLVGCRVSLDNETGRDSELLS